MSRRKQKYITKCDIEDKNSKLVFAVNDILGYVFEPKSSIRLICKTHYKDKS